MDIKSRIFNILTLEEFQEIALDIFRFQYNNVKVYHDYVSLLGVVPDKVETIEEIPFLPIQFFKTHNVIVNNQSPQITFTSSGTTGNETSKHLVSDKSLYIDSFTKGFELFYGNPGDYCILALLPSYLERTGSSLVFMVDELIRQTKNSNSGFFLNQYDELIRILSDIDSKGEKCLLIGVSFALLDIAEKYHLNLENIIVMETGGMKGRRKEIIRNELHGILCNAFGVGAIHSEYGMTELLSQAYSNGNGIFRCPPWMKVLVRDLYDPLSSKSTGSSGAINIIDLANINSCAFIQTQDLGKLFGDGSFEVLGRMGNAPVRGCNLLVYE
ncbi:MAG: acyltransferase [Bacteroidales bacterium]